MLSETFVEHSNAVKVEYISYRGNEQEKVKGQKKKTMKIKATFDLIYNESSQQRAPSSLIINCGTIKGLFTLTLKPILSKPYLIFGKSGKRKLCLQVHRVTSRRSL